MVLCLGDPGEVERALPEAGILRLHRHHFRLDQGITVRMRQTLQADNLK